ncbi:uncharacterized protein LOC112993714 isoform X1 [Dromaius novaehollandiae]|uniref:uncharacterized protein LOC112993714 isoform X1 n=1 Tax=Dromaius novaehollandiae TaxID=8790 RepID=UPI00311F1003
MRPGLLCAFAAAFLAVAGADHGNSKKAKTEIREKEVGTSVPGKRRPYRPCSGCFSVLSEESNPLSRSTREVEEVQQSIWPPKRKPGKKNPEGRRPPQSQSYETDVLRGARRREQPGEQRRVKREDKKPSRVQPVRKPGGSSVVRKDGPSTRTPREGEALGCKPSPGERRGPGGASPSAAGDTGGSREGGSKRGPPAPHRRSGPGRT